MIAVGLGLGRLWNLWRFPGLGSQIDIPRWKSGISNGAALAGAPNPSH